MSFWSSNTAAPSWIDTLFKKEPGYLRIEPAIKPKKEGYTIRRGSEKDCELITQFWNTHYKGADWYTYFEPELVFPYLNNASIYTLLVYKNDELVCTILSVPSKVVFSHIGEKSIRIIEGLCVHSNFRSMGIAGFAISYMDWYTSQSEPTIHLWCREEKWRNLIDDAISRKVYSYKYCSTYNSISKRPSTFLQKLSISEAEKKWNNTQHLSPFIYTQSIQVIRGDLDFWQLGTQFVIVTNTRRFTKNAQPIYEIIWNSKDTTIHTINYICDQYDGIMYTTVDPIKLDNTWISRTSGYLAWYIYNFIPPSFNNCSIDLIREEI